MTSEKQYRTGRDALTPAELEKVFLACDTALELALISVAVDAGCRREDVIKIQTGNITFLEDGARIKYWESKKNRWWEAVVGSKTAQRIRLLMDRYPKTPYLFPPRQKNKDHVSSKSAYNYFQRVLDKAGLRRRPFHSLRATCMKLCQKKGWTIEQTMEHTGDSWRTVQNHYLTPSDDEMEEVARDKPLL